MLPTLQVTHIQQNTKIPVLGHADGICHVYVDRDADIQKACAIVVDSKVRAGPGHNLVQRVNAVLPCLAKQMQLLSPSPWPLQAVHDARKLHSVSAEA